METQQEPYGGPPRLRYSDGRGGGVPAPPGHLDLGGVPGRHGGPLGGPGEPYGGPPEEMDQGYGEIQYLPPPSAPPLPTGPPPQMNFQPICSLDDIQCRHAMLRFIAENVCYGSKPAKEHVITQIQASSTLHYILETFCEARITTWRQVPFRGQPIDGPQNGIAPGLWDIPCKPDNMFQDQKKLLEVPHTATVQACRRCDAYGNRPCHRCNGGGRSPCHSCNGTGQISQFNPQRNRNEQKRCHTCNGQGYGSCRNCNASGHKKCGACGGYRNLKSYQQLEVVFTNHRDDYVMEGGDIPENLIYTVQGVNVFEQVMFQVWPIRDYPVPQIAQNSARLVELHRTKFPNERLLQQRQALRAVPVTKVDAEWNDWKSRYWVYGLDRKVHCPDYPQTCCCGCQIL